MSEMKLRICQDLLEGIVDGDRYYCAWIVRDRKIIIASRTLDPMVEPASLNNEVSSTFEQYEEIFTNCIGVSITIPQRTLIFRKLNSSPERTNLQFYLIVICRSSHRYYRKTITKLSENLCEILFAELKMPLEIS